ncbi:N-acetylmuramidase domain-containing protein [Mesorhizobium sp. BHbsci]
MDTTFKGAARRLDDLDLPKLGARIGVGEDEIHAFLEVETSGHGFDAHGRPIILFEPHVFSATCRGRSVRKQSRPDLPMSGGAKSLIPGTAIRA